MASFHNPLSLAVPPTELQRWYREQVVLKMQEASSSSSGPSLKERSKSFSTSQAPAHPAAGFLRAISFNPQTWRHRDAAPAGREHDMLHRWQQLTQEPRPWGSEFLGLETLPRGYSVPATWQDGRSRLLSNVEHYLGNYLWTFLLILLSSFYKQPVAMLGVYLLWRLSEELHRQALEYSGSRNGWRGTLMRWGVYALMWVVALYFRVIMAVVVALLVSSAAVGLHGSLREPALLQLKPT